MVIPCASCLNNLNLALFIHTRIHLLIHPSHPPFTHLIISPTSHPPHPRTSIAGAHTQFSLFIGLI